MRTKFNLKFLVALGIMLLAILVFNMNTVNAMSSDEEQKLVDEFPDIVYLDTTVMEQVDNITKNHHELDITNINFKEPLPEGYSIKDNKIVFEQAGLLHLGIVSINYNGEEIGFKYIEVRYNDTSKQNSETKQAVKKLVDKFYEGTNFTFEYTGELSQNEASKKLISDISKMTSIDNMNLVVVYSSRDDEDTLYYGVAIFVDDIYYDGLQGTQKLIKNTATTETVTKTDSTTNIKLDADTSVVPSNTVLEVNTITEGTTYNTVKTVLSDVSNFKVFDITLKSNGVVIQPNGKVKISIPVPNDFDKSNLIVYRVAEDGTKTKYDVKVEGNYATFETNHFSTYVLAENNVTETQETQNTPTEQTTQNKGEKDDTPKTGAIDIIGYVVLATVVAGAGIIVLKKKETK